MTDASLKGLSDAVLGPVLGADGKPLRDDAMRDSEGMTLVDGDTRQGTAYVSFERKHRIARYPFTAERFGPPTGTVPLPAAAKAMVANRGIEAMALIKTGKLEGNAAGVRRGPRRQERQSDGLADRRPDPGGILLKRIGGFDITDAAALPDGGRRAPGATIPLQRGHQDAHPPRRRRRDQTRRADRGRGAARCRRQPAISTIWKRSPPTARPSGETVLTLMSDDNFSALQRTLIMQFTLPETKPVLAGPRD